ncbi:uncharacterized protein [Montipora foliosa]|uniref:uncharacterized protein n=1 Tax=Montipora foliosa TaxID=591990 RepID=UPI0035F15B7C
MSVFASQFVAAAFQSDLEAIYAKYTGEDSDDLYLSEYLDEGRIAGIDSTEDEGESSSADGIEDENDGDDGWESDKSGPNVRHDLSDDTSVVGPGPTLAKNETFVVAQHTTINPTADQKRRDHKESFTMHDAATAEKLQVKASSSLTNIATLPFSDMQEQKGKDLKNRTCDATYLIYSDEGYVSSRPLELSNACDKQVSSASPFSSLDTRRDAMLSSEFLSVGSDTDKDLVQAVLCSRNKIALALAEITRKTWLRSSKLCSEEMACPVDGKIFASSKSVEDLCCTHVDKMFKSNVSDVNTSVIDEKSFDSNNKGNKVPDLENFQPPNFSLNKSSPFVQRQSVRLTSDSSPPKTLEISTFERDEKSFLLNRQSFDIKHNRKYQALKSRSDESRVIVRRQHPRSAQICCFDKSDVKSQPSRKRSVTLCQLTSSGVNALPGENLERNFVRIPSVGSDEDTAFSNDATTSSACSLVSPRPRSQLLRILRRRRSSQLHLSTNLDGCALDPHSSSPVVESQTALSRNRTITSGQRRVPLEMLSQSPVSVRPRKSSKVLRVNDGVFSTKSGGTKVVNFEYHNDRRGKCQVFRTECSEESDEVFEDLKKTPLGNDKLKDLSQDVREMSSKRGVYVKSCVDQVASTSQMISTSLRMISARKTSDREGTEANINSRGHRRSEVSELRNSSGGRIEKEKVSSTRQTSQLFCKIGREAKRLRTAQLYSSCQSGNRIALRANPGRAHIPSDRSPPTSVKKRARESFVSDSLDSLPRKQPRRSPSLLSNRVQGSQSSTWQGRESTPVKGNNVKKLGIEGFSSQMKLLSPVRSPSAETFKTSPQVFVSPCKGQGSCDKSFCFNCCW